MDSLSEMYHMVDQDKGCLRQLSLHFANVKKIKY